MSDISPSPRRSSNVLPLPTPNSLTSPQGRLCERCASIDLDDIFDREAARALREDRPSDQVTLNAIDLGTTDSWDSTCALCMHLKSDRRFRQDYKPTDGSVGQYWHLSFAPPLDGLPTHRGLRLDHRQRESFANKTVLSNVEDSDVHIQAIGASGNPRYKHGARIVKDQVDFHLIRNWLSRCENEHICGSTSVINPSISRVIDCEDRGLIPYDGQAYVALSYVWGRCAPPTPDEDALVRSSMSLPANVPQTIEDAITITKRMGLRYLWVDRFCVDQYHSSQKISQINAMGDIYASATLTILALVEDAQHGIPGVSQIRREQLLLNSSTTKYNSICQSKHDYLQKATYSHRAWTYQEFRLSRRLLIFSKPQVFFLCGQTDFQEGITEPEDRELYAKGFLELYNTSTRVLDTGVTRGLMTPNYRARLEDLKVTIIEYSKRSLSFKSDSLNAFRGMLSRSGLRTFYGHPVHSTGEDSGTKSVRVSRDSRGFPRSLFWPGLIDRHLRGGGYDSVLEYLEDLQSHPEIAQDPKFQGEPSLPTWSWPSLRPLNASWTWEDLYLSKMDQRYCSIPTIHVFDKAMQETTLHQLAVDTETSMLPETSHRLIFKDAVVLHGLDLLHLAYLARPYTPRDPTTGLYKSNTWKNPTFSLDPSAGEEILEILNGVAELQALLIDADSSKPNSFYSDEGITNTARNWGAYFTWDVELRFILLCRKIGQPCRRVGALGFQLATGGPEYEDVVFVREKIELV